MSEHVLESHQKTATKQTPAVKSREPSAVPADKDLERKLDKREARAETLAQVKDFAAFSFDIAKDGADRAIDFMENPELPQTDMTKHLLSELAVTAVSAATGGVVGWVMTGLQAIVGHTGGDAGGETPDPARVVEDKYAKKAADAASSAIGGVLRKALNAGEAKMPASVADLKKEFAMLMDKQCLAAKQRFIAAWPEVKAQLNVLSDDELNALNRLSTSHDPGEAYVQIMRSTFAQWANFLARAKHGAMGEWDHWATSGTGSKDAVPLSGAQAAPSKRDGIPDPTKGNVDPNRMGWALSKIQRPMQDEHFGVLEIFLDVHSLKLSRESGYGMRLDNVGPGVRAELRKFGTVRELPVNKLVRLVSYVHNGVRVDPPISVASILVTADGYVRASFGFDKLHFEPKQGPLWDPTGFGECMDTLIEGKETASCHIDKKLRAKDVTTVAEVAQNLSLTNLGG